METTQKDVRKKEYVCPNIIVRNVRIKNCLLGRSTTSLNNEACEDWTQNMDGVLGGSSGGFHNDSFTVGNSSWGDDEGAL